MSTSEKESIDLAPDAPDAAGEAPAPAGPTFAELGLGAAVQAALADMGFTAPMKVQATTIPLVQAGTDLMVQSRTGSGKTAAFGIPVVDKVVRADDKFVQAIILLPTRELALQVASELTRISAHSGITVVPVYGGAPMGRQIEQLKAGGQIVCGTPGRILDHMRRGTLVLDRVKCAILDECDEMLSMGFQEDIEAILERTPVERQTLLFSATVPEGIQRLSRRFLRNPQNVKLSADFVGVQEIRHVYYTIPGGQRENELLRVLAFENPGRAIVFCNTREETGRVAEFLRRQGFDAEAISSDLAQNDREKVMARMREGGIQFLVATDVAARGIDLEALSHVINYTFPESPEIYIHRTGRTGRAGRHGTAISLIGPTEVGAFYYVKLLYKIKPEERSLPSEAEIRSKREGERIESMRTRFHTEPGASWRSLARRLMAAVDGERLCAAMLAEHFAQEKLKADAASPPVAIEPRTSIVSEPKRDSLSRSGGRDRFRDRGDRPGGGDRPRYGERGERDAGRERGRDGERPRLADRPRDGERARTSERTERTERPREGERVRDSERTERARTGESTARLAEAAPPAASLPEQNGTSAAPAAISGAIDVGASNGAAERERNGERERPRRTRERSGERERSTREPRREETGAAPQVRSETPARGSESPARVRSETPARGSESPARVRSESPTRGSEPPARGSEIPARGSEIPARDSEPAPRTGRTSSGGEPEFWSVWSDNPPGTAPAGSSGETARPAGAARSSSPRPTSVVADFRASGGAPTGPNDNEARLFLNLGRKDDASADEVLALFADLGVVIAAADINLMNTHAYVNVPAADADRLCEGLSGRDRNGRPLLCERARPRRR